jgi:hypothetical protein
MNSTTPRLPAARTTPALLIALTVLPLFLSGCGISVGCRCRGRHADVDAAAAEAESRRAFEEVDRSPRGDPYRSGY